jgi:hypothetical protein
MKAKHFFVIGLLATGLTACEQKKPEAQPAPQKSEAEQAMDDARKAGGRG